MRTQTDGSYPVEVNGLVPLSDTGAWKQTDVPHTLFRLYLCKLYRSFSIHTGRDTFQNWLVSNFSNNR